MKRLYTRIYLHILGAFLLVGFVTAVSFVGIGPGAVERRFGPRIAELAGRVLSQDVALSRAHLQAHVAAMHERFGLEISVWDAQGALMASAGELDAAPADARARVVRDGQPSRLGHRPWRTLVPIVNPNNDRVVGVADVRARPHDEARWILAHFLLLGIILAGVALASAPLARRLASPLESLERAAQQFGEGDLGRRLPPAGRDAPVEIARLTSSFNDMASKIETLVKGQKSLLANVSHELRSPLARLRVALALLPRDEASRARLDDMERDIEDLEALVGDILTGARLESAGRPRTAADVAVAPLLQALAQKAAGDPTLAGCPVNVATQEGLTVFADEALLRRALWNLMENAAKYGAPPITLGAELRGNETHVWVGDRGSGIPAAERDRVVEPFYRRDEARTPSADGVSRGVGLGLTLARQIALAHGGALEIGPEERIDGIERGCRVTLRLPAAHSDGSSSR